MSETKRRARPYQPIVAPRPGQMTLGQVLDSSTPPPQQHENRLERFRRITGRDSFSVEARLYCENWALAPLDQLGIDRLYCPEHRDLCRVVFARRTDRFGRVMGEESTINRFIFSIMEEGVADYQETMYRAQMQLYQSLHPVRTW